MLRFLPLFSFPGAGVPQLLGAIILAIGVGNARAEEGCLPAQPEGSALWGAEALPCVDAEPQLDLTVPDTAAARTTHDAALTPSPAANDSAPSPAVIVPRDAGGAARVSIETLRAYNAQIAADKAASTQSRSASPLKSALVPTSPLDVWTSVDAQGFDSESGRRVKAGAGIDYRVIKNASIGVAAERAEQTATSTASSSTAGEKVSAYVAFKALPAVTLDARTQWERADTFAAASETSEQKGSVVLAPRLSKPIALDTSHTLEPYLEVKRELSLAGSSAATSDSAGAGVSISKSGAYSMSLSTDISEPSDGAAAAMNSKLHFKLPLD